MHRSWLVGFVLLVGACTDGSTTTDGSRSDQAGCDHKYAVFVPAAGGATDSTIDVRAELPSDLAPADLWRVTATACDFFVSPDGADCPVGAQCQPRPTPRCTAVQPDISDDGLLSASCGHDQVHNDGMQVNLRSAHYLNVTFRVQQ